MSFQDRSDISAPLNLLDLGRGRAEELGDILIKAFDSPTSIPYQALNLHSHMPIVTPDSQTVLSEFGTQQVAPLRLSF